MTSKTSDKVLDKAGAAEKASTVDEANAERKAAVDRPPSPTSAATVTVACKMPNGLRLRVYRMVEQYEQAPGGPRRADVARQVGDEVVVRGCAVPFGEMPEYAIIGGYALTPGVPRDFFEEWLRQNRDNPIVVRNLIFAHELRDHVEGRAREQANLRTGLEPVDPANPPQGFRRMEAFNPKT